MGQNGLFHASSGSQIHLLTTVHPEIASRGSQWPVRRAGVPGEGAVTTVTAVTDRYTSARSAGPTDRPVEVGSAQSAGPTDRTPEGECAS